MKIVEEGSPVPHRRDDRPLLCVTLRVMRAACGWKQKALANALKIDPKALSDLERGLRRGTIPRALLVRAARAMGRPEGLVDLTILFIWRFDVSLPPRARKIEDELRVIFERLEASNHRIFGKPAVESRLTPEQERLLATERAMAAEIWKVCLPLPREVRADVVTSDKLPHRWGVAERLWLESVYASSDDLAEAHALAELSRAVVDGIEATPVVM